MLLAPAAVFFEVVLLSWAGLGAVELCGSHSHHHVGGCLSEKLLLLLLLLLPQVDVYAKHGLITKLKTNMLSTGCTATPVCFL